MKYSINDIKRYQPSVLPFEGAWRDCLGRPEMTGTWLIWGSSGNGKTRFALQLAKYLSHFCRVAYDSLEEGLSLTLQRAIEEIGFVESVERKNFCLLDKENIADLRIRLKRRNAPQVVIIDSLQYTGMNYTEYKKLRDGNRNTLFIFISHADGREPKGEVAKSIRYDANVKVMIEGFRANAQSRYGGGKPYIIWDKGLNKI